MMQGLDTVKRRKLVIKVNFLGTINIIQKKTVDNWDLLI